MMDYIPAEVLEQIFDYLPVKDIINCLKVNLTWLRIIEKKINEMKWVENFLSKP